MDSSALEFVWSPTNNVPLLSLPLYSCFGTYFELSRFVLKERDNPSFISSPSSIVSFKSNLFFSFYLTDKFLKRLILIIILPLSLATFFYVAFWLKFRTTCKANSVHTEQVYKDSYYYNFLYLSPTPIIAKNCSLPNSKDGMRSQKTQFHCLVSTSLSEVLVILIRCPRYLHLPYFIMLRCLQLCLIIGAPLLIFWAKKSCRSSSDIKYFIVSNFPS